VTESGEVFKFTGRQKLVHGFLVERNWEFADLYESALHVYSDQQNPSRLRLAAYALREITGSLHGLFDFPIPEDPGKISDQARILEPFWVRATQGQCLQEGIWKGDIDDPLRGLLEKLNEFFEWLKESRGMRRLQAEEMFRKADPSVLSLPEPLGTKVAERWLALHRYLNGVLHGESTTSEEFAASVDDFEKIVIENIYRQPSEDLSVIDSILNSETTKPKPEAIARLLREINKSYSQYLYFFDNINSPVPLIPMSTYSPTSFQPRRSAYSRE
jgi:hypothetical protein